jgi:hypothetical protein
MYHFKVHWLFVILMVVTLWTTLGTYCEIATAQGNNNVNGVLINPEGLIYPAQQKLQPALAMKRSLAFLKSELNQDVQIESTLRKVSLTKLSNICNQLLNENKELPAEIKYLAGMTRIDYLFIDEGTKEIVIAGPAGPFAPNAEGFMCNTISKRPVLRLDDLLIAMRASSEELRLIGCSIDPVQQNLLALQRELQRTVPLPASAIQQRYAQLTQILGRNDVVVLGIKPDNNLARVLVEADLRMKRISMGLDPSLVKGLPSHLAMLEKSGNALQRWWFTPYYEAIFASAERDAFEFSGQRAQLLSQDEISTATGERQVAATQKVSTHKWAKLFTDKYPEISEKWLVFAELQNAMDLILVSYLIDKENLPERFSWNREVFLNPEKIPCGNSPVPKHTAPIYNTKKSSGGMYVGLISGGVTINPQKLLQTTPEIDGTAKRLHGLKVQHLTHVVDRFWWD